jgi:catechol 2,3-dioxygenase-like lactoylglutathione lyase family enzyme
MEEYRARLLDKGVQVTEIINHANSLDGGHKPDYGAATDDGDVFIRSMYFRDPNGTMLEFASWTRTLDASDVRHAPARAAVKV